MDIKPLLPTPAAVPPRKVDPRDKAGDGAARGGRRAPRPASEPAVDEPAAPHIDAYA